MAGSRTGTARHKQWRQALIRHAKRNHQTACPICGTRIDWDTKGLPSSPEADHVIPVAHGGTETLDNGRIICRKCNQRLGGIIGANTTNRKRRRKQTIKPRAQTTSKIW
ncbi:HNH endonuclease [Trueperella pyogenes]|uniref:HNH endonuclease n=1 Tax=Trueperella pyogenes TaxID=1661 RepID=A0A3Q9GF66_9ACTO|nr:HNH endonuclease [Trueperella pyogenes]QIU87086.1 HNH endonuclease [Trueperella pyogenes]